jgi:hypothetical protein
MKRGDPGSCFLGTLLLMACLLGADQAHARQEVCGGQDSGSCFEVNSTPGCDCFECCEYICAIDRLCCDGEWDQVCVDWAIRLCGECPYICDDTLPDCNGNGVPDECDIADGTSEDCNSNGVPDECDIAEGTSADCNGNGVPDECDIAYATSEDCNNNGVPDECEGGEQSIRDCNGNGQPDLEDIATGVSIDADGDGIPDECEGLLDVVFVLDVTASKSSQYLGVQIADDLASDKSILLAAIQDRSDGCAHYGMVTFRDLVEVNLPLTCDAAQLQIAASGIGHSGGGGTPEASDRALLEVLLEGAAENCLPPSKGYECCTGDGNPDLCTYPPVCLAGTQRFDVPFRKDARRIVVHATDAVPGGCDDVHSPLIDPVFAERIADLAGDQDVHVLAVADASGAVEAAALYADRSDGLLITPYDGNCVTTIEDLALVLRGLDVGTGLKPCCPADLNGDGFVNGPDITVLLSRWGTTGPAGSVVGDLNCDGTVNGQDITVLLTSWGPCS